MTDRAPQWQNRHVAPWDTNCLTPTKLASFYRLVGGDYDSLFFDTEEASLSFIYQSLGCFHTLEPERDPYTRPSTPALTPQGFVRWQTVQLLLEPGEHVPFLQNAVKRFGLINPADGAPFPSTLPKETLPVEPDADMIEWYATVSENLMLEAQASAARDLPPRPKLTLSDFDLESSRDSSVDSHSVIEMAGPRNSYRSAPFANGRPSVHLPPQYMKPQYTNDAPWSPECRHNSLPNNKAYPASWPRDGPTPTSTRSFPQLPIRNTRPHHHQRAPSDLSTISTSTDDSSSITTSSASVSPVRYHAQLHPPTSPGARRHSTHFPPQRPASHPQEFLAHQRQPSGEYKTKSVRWQDMDNVYDGPRFNTPNYRGQDNRSASASTRGVRLGDNSWDERERGRGRSAGPVTAVGGRRYPDRTRWR